MRLLLLASLAAAIHVPHGYHVSVYATGLHHPTAIAFGPDGRLYVAQDTGQVVSVRSGSRAGRPFARGLTVPLGLLWRGRTLYVSESGKVEALRAGGGRRVVVRGLPYGRHQQDTIVAGPDGRLYLGSGSTCDACVENDPRSAAILSFRADGSDLRVVATGLRNPYGLVFANGSLYATVNGRDDLGKNEPAEMVVRIRRGADYGWPSCWPGYALRRLIGACKGVAAPARLPRAALVGRRDRLVARRPLRRRMGRVPLTRARTTSRAHPRWTRDDLRDRFRSSARARRRPQPRTARRGLGPGRDLLDR